MKTFANHQIPANEGQANARSSSTSPPPSPRRLSRTPHSRLLHRSRSGKATALCKFPLIAFLLRLHIRLLLLIPLLYFPGLLMCVETYAALASRSLPGSLYRSREVFDKFWPEMQSYSNNASALQWSTIWEYSGKLGGRKSCESFRMEKHPAPKMPPASGYLIVEANGGLNQQRSSICNAVAVAGLLNATLVLPKFQFHNIWKDPSKFEDIYDEDHFISALKGHVRVVRNLPKILMQKFEHNISNIRNYRVKAWAPASYYLAAVYPVLQKQGVLRISPFANRLATEAPPHIQHLRCMANYQALKFSVPIAKLAEKLVARMIRKSSATGGKYASVHLRFEEDMVAFSCCIYDGGKEEERDMELARERGWGEKFKREGRIIRPDLNRINGRCPLTPLEVGMMLRGMGFNNDTSIYLASGKIYHEERYLAPLQQMFPLLETKESLATPEELASFQGYSSRLAALDYAVSLHSEVFVTTQGGNFPHFLMGHRRYLYNEHAKTIIPDKRQLVFLLQNTSISWTEFKGQMQKMLTESKKKGMESRQPGKSIYAYPSPECTCSIQINSTHARVFIPEDAASVR